MSAEECLDLVIGAQECLWMMQRAHEDSSAWFQNDQKLLILKMTSLEYFPNNSVQIWPNNKKSDNFKIYTSSWKMSKMEFLDPWKAEKLKKTEAGIVLRDTL